MMRIEYPFINEVLPTSQSQFVSSGIEPSSFEVKIPNWFPNAHTHIVEKQSMGGYVVREHHGHFVSVPRIFYSVQHSSVG